MPGIARDDYALRIGDGLLSVVTGRAARARRIFVASAGAPEAVALELGHVRTQLAQPRFDH